MITKKSPKFYGDAAAIEILRENYDMKKYIDAARLGNKWYVYRYDNGDIVIKDDDSDYHDSGIVIENSRKFFAYETDNKQTLTAVPYYAELAQKIVVALEMNEAPWRGSFFAPVNGVSGNKYHALNALNLMLAEYHDPRWLTFNQILAAGGQVKKGEHGAKIQFWQTTKWQDKMDENGEPVIGADNQPEREEVKLDKPLSLLTVVFNVEQCVDLPEFVLPENLRTEGFDRTENLVKALGISLVNDDPTAANRYDFKTDAIHLKPREEFASNGLYYSELCRQIIKATAHKSRENRYTGVSGSVDRAMEEMRVDIAATMLMNTLGIGGQPQNPVSPDTTNTWRKVLKEHPAVIINVAKEAERAVQYVLNCEKELLLMQGNETAPTNNIAAPIKKEERIYLRVSFDDKDKVKELGGKWEPNKSGKGGQWYIPENTANKDGFKRWYDVGFARQIGKEEGRTYLSIKKENPADKEAVKALGAKFDAAALLWYAPADADAQKFSQWTKVEPTAALPLRDQAAKKMADVGLTLEKEHPIIDGKYHRCAVIDDKPGQVSGLYVVHTDGVPNVFVHNYRTKETVKEKLIGVHLSREEMQTIKATASSKLVEQKKDLATRHDRVAKWCAEKIASLIDLSNGVTADGTPSYFREKKIEVHKGVFFDAKNGTLNVPLSNVAGEIRSICYINPESDGYTKAYAKGSEKTGNFHVIDGEKLADAQAVIISEGFATAATIKEALGERAAVVMAGDSGNLKPVAESINSAFPDKALVIACDDDQTVKSNPGKTHAEEAARAVNAALATPYFSDETRAAAKAAGVEHLSDFNDMEQFHSGYAPKDILLEALDQALTQMNTKERAELRELEKEKVRNSAKEKTPVRR